MTKKRYRSRAVLESRDMILHHPSYRCPRELLFFLACLAVALKVTQYDGRKTALLHLAVNTHPVDREGWYVYNHPEARNTSTSLLRPFEPMLFTCIDLFHNRLMMFPGSHNHLNNKTYIVLMHTRSSSNNNYKDNKFK